MLQGAALPEWVLAMNSQHCDKCPVVTIGGFEHQALCENCAARLTARAATLCCRGPYFLDIEPHRPEYMALVEWARVWFAGGHCEPRRWSPNYEVRCPRYLHTVVMGLYEGEESASGPHGWEVYTPRDMVDHNSGRLACYDAPYVLSGVCRHSVTIGCGVGV